MKEWTASEIEEYDDARLELAEDGKIDCTRVYIKEDVDKVIAGLKESRMAWIHRCGVAEEGERHQKYKRCLAMAKWCDDAARLATWDTDFHRCRWYNKWMQRWLELAEKFKEVK